MQRHFSTGQRVSETVFFVIRTSSRSRSRVKRQNESIDFRREMVLRRSGVPRKKKKKCRTANCFLDYLWQESRILLSPAGILPFLFFGNAKLFNPQDQRFREASRR